MVFSSHQMAFGKKRQTSGALGLDGVFSASLSNILSNVLSREPALHIANRGRLHVEMRQKRIF